jgi:hypothetical protein
MHVSPSTTSLLAPVQPAAFENSYLAILLEAIHLVNEKTLCAKAASSRFHHVCIQARDVQIRIKSISNPIRRNRLL